MPRRCLLGGGEARALDDLMKRIRLRLSPPSADELDAEVQRQAELHGGVDWFTAAIAVP